ncbi:MAG TPA: hypothetical protein ENI53_01570 [Thermoplasmatales archaeon]|nr:hypothetical protein [Thermoplasmatales archaeon]
MKVDMNIVQHLGISMYSTLPPVIAELIANAWDADANEVRVELNDTNPENKCIIIQDNGIGMSLKDIQDSFLVIGKNRRMECNVTSSGRKIIGRKGIGKLSMFGIADEIIITTVKDENGIRRKNRFRLDLKEMKTSGETYYPPHEIKNEETDEDTGTTIEIRKIRRKSPFDPKKIAVDLARRFLIFDDNFKVWIKHNDEDPILVTQDLRFEGINIEFVWEFPSEKIDSNYEHKDAVRGYIYTATKPVPEDMKGIYLIARGKLVHRNDFYGIRSSDYAHAYLTGWLEVDFIDDDPSEDNISTNRQELTWEKENMQKLRKYLQKVISFVTKEWREKRREKKEHVVKEKTGIDIPEWINSLDSVSRPVARKLINSILGSETIEEDRASEMIHFIYDMFEFESFRQMAAEIVEDETIEEEKVLNLLKKWEVVEAREMYKLSKVRIDTIKNFEKLIEENAREVPTMHEFFKKFPWLLDPRIMEFRHEVRFSDLLKENFPEDDIDGADRRIDFLCVRLGGVFFIIELKRPHHTLRLKDLEQAKKYRTFIEHRIGNESNEKVIAYVVTGKIPNSIDVQDEIETLRGVQKIYVRTYDELLQDAINYHNEFIERYEKLKEKTGENSESG